jgi:hypothetical protein
MLFTLERLSASSALVEKVWQLFPLDTLSQLLSDAYATLGCIQVCPYDLESFTLTHITRFFTLAMQSGAFLQLVLTLLALVSRLATICLEVLEALQVTSETIRDLLEVIFVCSSMSFCCRSPIACRHLRSDRQGMKRTARATIRRY